MMFTLNPLIVSTIILSIVTRYTGACRAGPSDLGAVTEDAQIREGTRFQITCNLKKLSTTYDGQTIPVNSSNIFFTRDSSSEPIIPQIVDKRSARIELKESHLNDSGRYYCYVQVGDHFRQNQLVCLMDLIVGQPPRDLDGINCVSEHYQNLTCVWNPPNYNTDTTYTLSEKATDAPCPHRINKTACEWTLSGYPHYRQAAHWIRLTLESSNKFGNHSQDFEINNFAIIRPPPPEKLAFRDVSPTSVELVWDIEPTLDLGPADGKSEHPILRFQIVQEDIFGAVLTTEIDNPVKSFKAANLTPATSYRFSVRCRTVQSDSDEFWSEFSNVTIATEPDVPYLSPVFLNETFDSIQTGNGRRSITLYWIPVAKKYSNTVNQEKFHYIIEATPTHVSRSRRETVESGQENFRSRRETVESGQETFRFRRETVNGKLQVAKSDESHLTFPDLSVMSAYNFRIYSANEHGRSLNFTEMTVDKEAALPPKPKHFQALSYGKGRYELRWEGIPDTDHYVVSWCLAGKAGTRECAGQMESEVVPQQHVGLPKTLSNLTGVDYNFAVSSVKNFAVPSVKNFAVPSVRNEYSGSTFVSSGVTWASCVVPMGATKPSKLPFSLSSIGTDSLQLQWKLSCPGLHVVISRFEIIFCRLTSKNGSCGEEKRILVNNSRAESYKLRGLDPDSFYRVTMRMWNDNTAGEESDPLQARTGIETDLTSPIIFGALALLLTSLMIAVCRKLFLKVKKDFKEMKQPVQLPGSLGDSYNLTKTIFGQTNGRNGHSGAVEELRKNSGCSVGSHVSSTGLITPKKGKPGNVFELNGTEMAEMKSGDVDGSAVRETCPDGNSNTSHDSGLGTQSNGNIPSVASRASSKAYVTHERLNEMGRCSKPTNPPSSKVMMSDHRSHSVICQIDGSSNSQSNPSSPSSLPARVRQGYVQV